MRRTLLLGTVALTLAMSTACRKHAPTSYELDVRAGHAYPGDWRDQHVRKKDRKRLSEAAAAPLSTTSAIAPEPMMPARVPAKVVKVWVSDQHLDDGSWLQGTWMFMEVEAAHWLDEVDPGGAPLVQPLPRGNGTPEVEHGH